MINKYLNAKVYIFAIIFLLSGCGITHQAKVPKTDDVSYLGENLKNKPVVYMDFKRFTGTPDDKIYDAYAGQEEQEYVHSLLKESDLFSEVIFDEYEKERAKYTLEISVFVAQGSVAGPLITGITLGLIPTPNDTTYYTVTKLVDRQGNIIYEYHNEDVVTLWMGLFGFLFADHVGTSPRYDMAGNNIRDSLKNLHDTNVLNKY